MNPHVSGIFEEVLGEQAKEIVSVCYLTWKPSRLDLLAILHKSGADTNM